MTSVGAYEAKTHLAALLDRVEGGETITITKHGRVVAKLVPAQPTAADPDETVDALRQARIGLRLGRSSIRSMIEEGRL